MITDYKEIELHDDSFGNDLTIPQLFQRVRRHLEECHFQDQKDVNWLPCHAIDLAPHGELNAHVDSIKFSGDIVSGLSLLSPSIMRLIPDQATYQDYQEPVPTGWVDLYLPPLSLYALTGVSRYRYSHELLPSGRTFSSSDRSEVRVVDRTHRLSVIFRDAKLSTES